MTFERNPAASTSTGRILTSTIAVVEGLPGLLLSRNELRSPPYFASRTQANHVSPRCFCTEMDAVLLLRVFYQNQGFMGLSNLDVRSVRTVKMQAPEVMYSRQVLDL